MCSQEWHINAAIRNGQHQSIEKLLSKRIGGSKDYLRGKSSSRKNSALFDQFSRGHHEGRYSQCPAVTLFSICFSIGDMNFIHKPNNAQLPRKYHSKFDTLFNRLYPTISNVRYWRKELHWSFPTFPTIDRETMNWLWHLHYPPDNQEIIPSEMLLRVFSFFGRGWFTCRMIASTSFEG